MINEFFKFTIVSLRRRKLRSWLTIIGIVIGIGSVVALISLGQGVQVAVNDLFETIGQDTIIVTPGGFSGPSSGNLLATSLTEDDVDIIKDVSGVEHTFGVITKQARVTYKDQNKFASIYGVPTDDDTIEFMSKVEFFIIEEGRFLKDSDNYKGNMGWVLAKDIFDSEIEVGDKVQVEGKTITVEGIAKKSGAPIHDGAIRIPIDNARELLDVGDEVTLIFVKVGDTLTPEEVKVEIEETLRDERDLEEGKEDFNVNLSSQLVQGVTSILNILQMGLVGIAGISLVVGALGIMNTMYTSVMERTKEIGIMKAIGATNKDIATLFMIESGIIGLLGGIIGIIIGGLLGKLVEFAAAGSGFEILKVHISPELIIFALVFSFVIGAISGVLPARQASKLKPVEAINKW